MAILSCIVISACKDPKTVNQPMVQKAPQKAMSNLIFDMHIKTTEPDVFSLFANDVFLNNNQFMSISIKHKLNGNETDKSLHFEFPKNIKPDHQMGISLGPNKVKDVTITDATLTYGDTEFKISQDNLMDYFTTNRYVDYDSETKSLKTKKVDGKYNPLLFFRKRILDSLQNIE